MNEKCRIHNKELTYCEDCIKIKNALLTVNILRMDTKGQVKVYKEALKKLENK